MVIDIDGINRLIEMGQNVNVKLEQQELIQFLLIFEKVVKILVLSNEPYELRLTKDHKLSAQFKRYHKDKDEKLIINMKRVKN